MSDFQPSRAATNALHNALGAFERLAAPGETLELTFCEPTELGVEIGISSPGGSSCKAFAGASLHLAGPELIPELLAEIRPGVGPVAARPPVGPARARADATFSEGEDPETDFCGAAGLPAEHTAKGMSCTPPLEPAHWKGRGKPPSALERRVDRAIEAAKAGIGKAGTLHRLASMFLTEGTPEQARQALLVASRSCAVNRTIRRIDRLWESGTISGFLDGD